MTTHKQSIASRVTGADTYGVAKTGSGKTATFAIPILQRLAKDPFSLFALVLTPTRELAFQISEQFAALGKPIGLRQVVSEIPEVFLLCESDRNTTTAFNNSPCMRHHGDMGCHRDACLKRYTSEHGDVVVTICPNVDPTGRCWRS